MRQMDMKRNRRPPGRRAGVAVDNWDVPCGENDTGAR
jgi:hypothetical protein